MNAPDHLGRRWSLCLAMLGLACAPVVVLPASASCAGPYLMVGEVQQDPTIHAAESLRVDGRAFVRGCDDTGSVNMFGCRSSVGEAETPMEKVWLFLRQGDQRWVLGVGDARSAADNRLGHITWRVRVPADVAAGPAVLVADVHPRGRNPMDTRLSVDVR